MINVIVMLVVFILWLHIYLLVLVRYSVNINLLAIRVLLTFLTVSLESLAPLLLPSKFVLALPL